MNDVQVNALAQAMRRTESCADETTVTGRRECPGCKRWRENAIQATAEKVALVEQRDRLAEAARAYADAQQRNAEAWEWCELGNTPAWAEEWEAKHGYGDADGSWAQSTDRVTETGKHLRAVLAEQS